jgi:hypothetical protein
VRREIAAHIDPDVSVHGTKVGRPMRFRRHEDAVRKMTAQMLERAGNTVLTASTPSEVSAIFEAEQGRI